MISLSYGDRIKKSVKSYPGFRNYSETFKFDHSILVCGINKQNLPKWNLQESNEFR